MTPTGYACDAMTPADIAFFVLLIPLVLLSVPLVVYWGVVLVRIEQTLRGLPTGMDGIALAEGSRAADPSVLVVVPAHNEAGTIGTLVRSLREQDHDRFRVVLALDRCTDATASVAREAIGSDHRFEITEIDDVAADWAGKVNAVRVGLERCPVESETEFFLFTDADCVLHPSCLRATVALAEERGLDLLSFLNEYPAESWYESIVQPVAGFELMRQYPLLRANRLDEKQRPFANGQFMLFRSGFYRAMGGHATVKNELLEDLALAKAVKSNGGRAGALLSGGMVRCRMYESWGDFKRGWRRIYTEAAHRRSSRLLSAAWRTRLLGAVFPVLVFLLACAAIPLGHAAGVGASLLVSAYAAPLLGLAFFLLAGARVLRVARGSLSVAPVLPVAFWLVSGLLFRAAEHLSDGRPTNWGGRSYHREDRSREHAAPTASAPHAACAPAQGPASGPSSGSSAAVGEEHPSA